MKEPVIHSHIDDMLPHEHPLAYKHFGCAICDELIHAGNNECMLTWVEADWGNYCIACFGTQPWSCCLPPSAEEL